MRARQATQNKRAQAASPRPAVLLTWEVSSPTTEIVDATPRRQSGILSVNG
jgi:hypothetical protein